MKEYILVIWLSRVSSEDSVVWPRFEPGAFHNRSLQYSAMATCSAQSHLDKESKRIIEQTHRRG